MTQQRGETSLRYPLPGVGVGAGPQGAPLASPGPMAVRCRAVNMQPTARAAKVSCKSARDAARGEPASSSGADLPAWPRCPSPGRLFLAPKHMHEAEIKRLPRT